MRLIGVDHYDHFPDCTIFHMTIDDIPADIQEAAKAIDGSEYSPDCFVLRAGYETASNELHVLTDKDCSGGKPFNIFYIDNDGCEHGFHVDLTEDFTQAVHASCRALLTEHGDKMPGYWAMPISKQLEAAKRLTEIQHGSPQEKSAPDRGDR